MKTAVALDEDRLRRLMEVAGLDTMEAAVEYALAEGERAVSGRVSSEEERIARVNDFYANMLPSSGYLAALSPGYDLMALREADKSQPDAAAH